MLSKYSKSLLLLHFPKRFISDFSNKYTLPKYSGSLYELKKDKHNIDEKIIFKLVEKLYITPDTFLAKFEIPNNNYLGCPLGQHIYVHSTLIGPNKRSKQPELMSKRYTPISLIDTRGYFSLIIKVYRPNQIFPKGGMVSQYVDKIKVNENIVVSGPVGKMQYLGEGEMLFKDSKESWNKFKYSNICFIAAGTGITPIFQILQSSHINIDQIVNFSLIYANRSEEEIILESELEEIYQKKKIKFQYLKVIKNLKNPDNEFKGLVGEICKQHIIDYFPRPGSETIIMICGRKEKTKLHIIPMLKDLGYNEENIFIF